MTRRSQKILLRTHFSFVVLSPALMTQCMSARDELKAILQAKSIRTGDFTLASGKKSDFYVDCRVSTMDCRGAILVGEVGFATVAGEDCASSPKSLSRLAG